MEMNGLMRWLNGMKEVTERAEVKKMTLVSEMTTPNHLLTKVGQGKAGKAAVILTKNQKEFTSTWKVAVILLKKNVYLKRIQKRTLSKTFSN